MFDITQYEKVWRAAESILQRNLNTVGANFANAFLNDHDPRLGGAAARQAELLYDYIVRQGLSMNGGQQNIPDQIIFSIVEDYIKKTFAANQPQQQQSGFGGGMGMGGFSRGNNGGGSMFGNPNNGGFGQPQSRPTAGSHLGDDTVDRAPSQASRPAQASSMFSAAPSAADATMIIPDHFVDNPFDDFPETGLRFSNVEEKTTWGDPRGGQEKPADNRIILARRGEMKTEDPRWSAGVYESYHRLILNDPMDVVKDFFAVVPDYTLGTSFLFRIFYNHLDVIDVPTADFVDLRTRCIDAVRADPQTLLYLKVSDALKVMPYGQWQAMSKYLTKHINRALHLSCRLSGDPVKFLQLEEFNDLNDLMASTFRSSFTAYPEGRRHLEKIVSSAIWNALVTGADAMFADGFTIPTNAMQSSPVFPYSMPGIYPNKYAIPTQQEATAETFMKKLQENVLSKQTYVLSRRTVNITNILGKAILPKLASTPQLFTSTPASILNNCVIPFNRSTPDDNDAKGNRVQPYVSEEYPSEQLENYYNNPQQADHEEVGLFARKHPTRMPLDQHIFAIQYGVKPENYLTSVDIHSTIDGGEKANQVLLSKHPVPMLKLS